MMFQNKCKVLYLKSFSTLSKRRVEVEEENVKVLFDSKKLTVHLFFHPHPVSERLQMWWPLGPMKGVGRKDNGRKASSQGFLGKVSQE